MSKPIEGDKSMPDGVLHPGSWRKQIPEEKLPDVKTLQRSIYGEEPIPTPVQTGTDQKDGSIVSPESSFLLQTPARRFSLAFGGLNLSGLMNTLNEEDEQNQGSEQTKPPVYGLGEEFHPYTLPQGPYRGAESLEEALSMWQAKAATVTLHTGLLPDLDFQIVTIPSEVEAGKTEIIIESSVTQALQLGLLHKTGRRAAVFPSWQPYGFNGDILPIIERLRFSFIDSKDESEALPEIRRTGQVQFRFTATEAELTPDLRARFDLSRRANRGRLHVQHYTGRHPHPATGTF